MARRRGRGGRRRPRRRWRGRHRRTRPGRARSWSSSCDRHAPRCAARRARTRRARPATRVTVVVLGATVVVVVPFAGRRCAAASRVTVSPFTSGAASTRSSRTLATATLISTISDEREQAVQYPFLGGLETECVADAAHVAHESSSPERARGDEVGYFRNTRFSGGPVPGGCRARENVFYCAGPRRPAADGRRTPRVRCRRSRMPGGFWYYAQEDPDALAVVDTDGTEITRRRAARRLQPRGPRAARASGSSPATRSRRSCPTGATRRPSTSPRSRSASTTCRSTTGSRRRRSPTS